MLSLSVKIGQAVQIGDAAVVRVDDKSGRYVRLRIATALSPIKLLADGIIPMRFTVGLGGEIGRTSVPMRPAAQPQA
jgi:hypothetical protein